MAKKQDKSDKDELIRMSAVEQGRNIGPTTLHFCIDESDRKEGKLSGSISGTAIEDIYKFAGLQEMAMTVDKILDIIGRPQATRTFRKDFDGMTEQAASYNATPKICHTAEEILSKKGLADTYDVLFQTRKYNSWQGMVFNEEGKIIGNFESEVQLFEILQGE